MAVLERPLIVLPLQAIAASCACRLLPTHPRLTQVVDRERPRLLLGDRKAIRISRLDLTLQEAQGLFARLVRSWTIGDQVYVIVKVD